jgi:hypothetical protein
MPCYTQTREAKEQAERDRQLAELEKELVARTAKIVRIGNRVSIEGWKERGGWCDACAVRKLSTSNNARIRQMVATAAPTTTGITFGHGH